MLDSLLILPSGCIGARIQGSWKQLRYWDWNGQIFADEPIVAVSLLRVGARLEWARSAKGPETVLEARLLLGWHDSSGHDVQVSFSVGNGPRWRATLADNTKPPRTLEDGPIPLGQPFRFCEPFGLPRIELFCLVLSRNQVIGARNGLWHLKPSLREGVSEMWQAILCRGRAGSVTLPKPS